MFDIVEKFRERGRALEPGARDCLKRQKSYRIHIIGGAVTLFLAMALPSLGRADNFLGTVSAEGYTFSNFDPTLMGAAAGSNANGISNTGQVVGFAVDAQNVPLYNYSGAPGSTTPLSNLTGQTALGINSAGNIVGGNGTTAFYLPNGGSPQTLNVPGGAIDAFGINDKGNIVGQFNTASGATPGFYLPNIASSTFTEIDAPAGSAVNIVNAQGVNDNGLVVGFYEGNDGNVHGFDASIVNAMNGILLGAALPDPIIPAVAGEPGATFVFSQILGINDEGIAVGYYGDSTNSQHGFLYNTNTGTYTFLDDPAEAFSNAVEVTQITGIDNAGDISGFYTDANGVGHSFIAAPPVPEPRSLVLMGTGIAGLAFIRFRRRRGAPAA
jgi:hypothetical protein